MIPEQKFVYTSALRKIRALKKRIHSVQGGTSGGKTYAILPILIDKAIRFPHREISVVSESIPHLKRGAIRDFKKIMRLTERWEDENWHDTDKRYTWKNGSYIEFFSPESILGARRTDLFVNEGNNLSFGDYHQLAIRTSDEIWVDFNPVAEFWAHTELLPDPDCDFVVLNYKDNEALSETIVREIEKAKEKLHDPYWANWWKVYGLGEVGTLEGVIFGFFNNAESFPNDCEWVAYGLDFGYSNDPSSLIKVGMRRGEIFLHQLVYKTGLTNSDLIAEMRRHNIGTSEIIADSADPKSIEELRRAGFNIRGALKGADSVNNGIDMMKRHTFNITTSSLDLIKEWRTYSWKKNASTNKFENIPVDVNNHAIDAVRYCLQYKIMPMGRTRFLSAQ